MRRNNAKIAQILGLFLVLPLVMSCKENEQNQIVPYTPVNLSLELSLPQFQVLQSPGSAIIFANAGYRGHGVIVYRLIDDFYAYDATCPQHIETPTAIELDGVSAGTATCPHCHTTYLLMTGFSQDGKAQHPLQHYRAWIMGNFVYVSN